MSLTLYRCHTSKCSQGRSRHERTYESEAINESFKNGDGEQREHVEWIRCVAWGKLAEVCGEFLTKGKQAYAEGRFQTRKYDDRDGNEHTVCEVVVRQLRLLSGPGNGNGQAEQGTRAFLLLL